MQFLLRSFPVLMVLLFASNVSGGEKSPSENEPEGESSRSIEEPAHDQPNVVVHSTLKRQKYQRGTGLGSAPVITGGGSGYRDGSSAFRQGVSATPEQTTDHEGDTCNVGNPVVPFTGNKIESELDFDTAGEMPLKLVRTYNHQWVGRGLFGKHWISSFDYSLAGAGTDTVWVQMPNGVRRKFRRVSFVEYREDNPASRAKIVANYLGAGGPIFVRAMLHEDNGDVISFKWGRIASRINAQGIKWTFVYAGQTETTPGGPLQEVVHSSGRTVQFFWSDGHVVKVVDPAGHEYRYSYDPKVFSVGNYTGPGLGRLKSVDMPGLPETRISYHYEDARFKGALTGKSINNERYSNFSYDDAGRATRTEHVGGVDRYTFSYVVESIEVVESPPLPVPPTGYINDEDRATCSWGAYGTRCRFAYSLAPQSGQVAAEPVQVKDAIMRLKTSVTNPLGLTTTSVFENGKLRETIGQPTANCPSSYAAVSYDANGYRQMVSDAKGNVTTFLHDAGGRLLKRVEAFGTPHARTTTYEWDSSSELIKSETIEGAVRVNYEYTPQRRYSRITRTDLKEGTPGQSFVTAFAYTAHDNGILSSVSVDGPMAGSEDVVISRFDAAGNLVSIENSKGHVTSYEGYNGLGQAGRIKGSNGDVEETDYDARGRIIAVRQSVAGGVRHSRYTYNSMGKIIKVVTPEGVEVENFYDLAGRLIRTTSPESHNVNVHRAYKYDLASNVIEITVTRDTPPVPEAPTVVIGSAFAVKWKAQPGVVRYVLQESKDGGAWTDVYSGAALEWTASGRPPGSYSYRIMACTADGQCSRAYLSEEPVVVKADLSPIINYLLNS